MASRLARPRGDMFACEMRLFHVGGSIGVVGMLGPVMVVNGVQVWCTAENDPRVYFASDDSCRHPAGKKDRGRYAEACSGTSPACPGRHKAYKVP